MNGGLIAGRVRRAGRPLENLLVGLDWVRTGEGILPIYSSNADSTMDRLRSIGRGVSSDQPPRLVNLNATTNSGGFFSMSFQWSGTDLGMAVDNPNYQVFVLEEEVSGSVLTMRLRGRFHSRMAVHVNLRQIANGLIPDPTQIADGIGMGADAYQILRGIRLPRMAFTIVGPSPDFYGLLGVIEIGI